tara:strand:- start:534 stop:731 length:198 start_codon:yes stop_codon:yes gene_type:complete
MPFFKVKATSIESFKAIVEANNEEEAYNIAKNSEGVIFDPVDFPNGDWEIDPEVKKCTENGDPIQ